MATECSQETVLRFLTERGGKVRNTDLIDHFRPTISSDPAKKAATKEAFKRYVDSVAVVKVENGEKYVCLKKKFRGCPKRADDRASDGGFIVEVRVGVVNNNDGGAHDAVARATVAHEGNDLRRLSEETRENGDTKQEISPGSGCGTGAVKGAASQNILYGAVSTSLLTLSKSQLCHPEMGNQPSTQDDHHQSNGISDQSEKSLAKNKRKDLDTVVPGIEVIEASPLPAATDGAVFKLPAPPPSLPKDAPLALAEACSDHTHPKGLGPGFELKTKAPEEETGSGRGSQQLRRRPSRGSQRGARSEAGPDDGHSDTGGVSGCSDYTPKGSRKNFIEHMMSSSPQVRRSMVLRNSVHLSARCKDTSLRSDTDSASVSSSNADDESAVVTLDPLEHEWMMCASYGEWESLQRLLTSDPNLITKKDFVTGFTCLHWAAKAGKHELLALLVNFTKKHGVPVNINVRSSAGYTPLHLAAMHNHVEVVKLLVGAYDADVEARDYNGKKAGQYLRSDVARDILDIVGAGTDSDVENVGGGDTGRWRLSMVLPANLRPLKLLNHSISEEDVRDTAQGKDKPLRRKSSLNKLKPRLSKIRMRTQIVHSTSLFDKLEREVGETSGSFRSRPKSNLFG